ncbi:hypothetical protein [Singulisphaera acidiphila]|uniref:Uncharacterized protein n=1 Tax=Singulisphaera acidiphila (strain ATCC BAA-1392 / DSM 18658 / VKM B-2454 / MOB10) TaxID=886293 RepID=L0DF17_SINAD|nr:hypothetical protein [Singulisphaera acidiphila]AGA27969.1 hypothetical protein Sinac_3731 [Singulisphaera acidiphila DSM 18658]
MIHKSSHWVIVAPVFIVVTAGSWRALGASGDDELTREKATANREAAAALNSSSLPEFQDPAFSRFVDLTLLRQAIARNDASQAADIALQLADGERVLLREHKILSADMAIRLAASIAVDTNDRATLQRLVKAAKNVGDDALASQIETVAKLGMTTRDEGQDLKVSLRTTTPDQLAFLKSVLQEADTSRRSGDLEVLGKLEVFVKALTDLPEEQKTFLASRIAKAKQEVPEGSDKLGQALKKLNASSRFAPFGNWQSTYIDPNGNSVNAAVTLNGASGSYYLPDGSVGQLYNISQGFPPGNPGVPVSSNGLYGQWQLGGSQGWFYWAMTGPNRFQGSWGFGNFGSPMVNRWWGTLSGGGGGGGGPVPVPVPFPG